ncbi:MAG: hypothetical protein F9K19_08675 [Rhizobiaceae bacterium]|nr:MAG: hypothetical protein F9K19_08675 [Rhizobiaceae bacterium]CAG1012341.1 hypothetical protein RHIZO_04232 [Rhizobiaceae bacterium]
MDASVKPYLGSKEHINGGEKSARRFILSSVIGGLSRKVGFDNQTLPESADDHRATQLHHLA